MQKIEENTEAGCGVHNILLGACFRLFKSRILAAVVISGCFPGEVSSVKGHLEEDDTNEGGEEDDDVEEEEELEEDEVRDSARSLVTWKHTQG